MNEKWFAEILKPFAAKLGWLGGSLAAITAILSAIGFLVLRSYQDLLGIRGFVPLPPEEWSVEGGRFLYNSLFYLAAGLLSNGWIILLGLASVLLLVSLTKKRWMQKIQVRTGSPAAKMIVLGGSLLVVLLVLKLFTGYEEPSHLLVAQLQYDDPIVSRNSVSGMVALRSEYALLTALLVFLGVWLKCLPYVLNIGLQPPVTEAATEGSSVRAQFSKWQVALTVLWFFFVIVFVYWPMDYGKMAKEYDFFQVQLIPKEEGASKTAAVDNAAPNSYKGWLLHAGADNIVLFHGRAAPERIRIFKRGDFAQIQILDFGNIFR